MEGLCAYALKHTNIERKFNTMLMVKWESIQLRAQTVLDNLASLMYAETPAEPLLVDIEFDLEDDTNGGSWPQNRDKEEELIA